MSQENFTPPPVPPPAPSAWHQPQVVIALITGIVTVIAAFIGIIPTLVQANQPTPTPPPTHTPTLTATFAPSATPTMEPSPKPVLMQEPSPSPLPAFAVPTTAADIPPSTSGAQGSPPNVLLIFDGVAFTVVNVSGGTLSLQGVRFSSPGGSFDATTWANAGRVPDGNCVRLRDATAGRRNPPPECRNLLSLMEVGSAALFWVNTSTFDVVREGVVIATCATDTDRCPVYIPQ
jgi:hypothetical protein